MKFSQVLKSPLCTRLSRAHNIRFARNIAFVAEGLLTGKSLQTQEKCEIFFNAEFINGASSISVEFVSHDIQLPHVISLAGPPKYSGPMEEERLQTYLENIAKPFIVRGLKVTLDKWLTRIQVKKFDTWGEDES